VTKSPTRSRAALGALMMCCAILPLLSSCSLYNWVFHRGGGKDAGCTERPFALNHEQMPPLKVPDGMSAPDTRNAIKVPDLAATEHLRGKGEPCLSRPPNYFQTPPKAQPAAISGAPLTELAPPPTAPAPAPAPPAPVPAPPAPANDTTAPK